MDNNIDNSETLVTLVSLIQTYLGNIDRLRRELSESRGILTDTFATDLKYMEAEEKAKAIVKEKKTIKTGLLAGQQAMSMSQKVKDLAAELKEAQATLSGYLSDYQKTTGATTIEDTDGNILQIVTVSKLVRGASPKDK